MTKYGIVGLGFISDRHIQVIEERGELVMGCDIDFDKMYKVIDKEFFANVQDMYNSLSFRDIDYVVIGTPNHLHAAMIKGALDAGKKVICEKPPVISMEEYNKLIEHPNIDNLFIILQCRYAKGLKDIEIKDFNEVELNVEVYRDSWYMSSWKAHKEQSGGLLLNIGCHYLDILLELFGAVKSVSLIKDEPRRAEGVIEFEKAKVKWAVAIDAPIDKQKRLLKINDKTYNLTQMGFEGLHGKVYDEILKGRGYRLEEFKPTLELIEKIYA